MLAELVVAGEETRPRTLSRSQVPPLHFRKTYFPGQLDGDPEQEFDSHAFASPNNSTFPPHWVQCERVFRSCLLPGQPYVRLPLSESSPQK